MRKLFISKSITLFQQKWLYLILLCSTLQGCFFVAGAAVGAVAVAVVYDHRKITGSIEDTQIANKIIDKLRTDYTMWKESHLEVTVYNRVVLLTGETPKPEWRQIAEEQAREIEGADKVYNQITIQNPTSTLTRSSDVWITTKVKTQMLASDSLKSGNIKVKTENGSVYLMGAVTREQADIAVDITRKVDGVYRVVKIFQYND
ncbi:MAG: hypothetical protein A3F14_03165 [Gammaproteobacteria bacterium RIFCSPHIGHO2_12_FULL_43_28]|nr:MAG: hypothetical protein A3F14_03165 [Gammaproteobacteria bacterium RIFCSPHIGHO2_12_FULL_43_28]